jgi:hypothetical protein
VFLKGILGKGRVDRKGKNTVGTGWERGERRENMR